MAFGTTLWSVVEDYQGAGERSEAAMGILCETYWRPLYLNALRRGLAEEEAKDAVQGFFLAMIEKRYLDAADASKGRFRTFLLTCFQRYLAKEHKRFNAQKRGGDFLRIHFEHDSKGDGLGPIASRTLPPDEQFDREWALSLIARAIERLRALEIAAGREKLISALGAHLFVDADTSSYARIAEEMGTTPNAVKVAAHRLRKRLRSLILEEVRITVNSKSSAEEELRHLLNAVSNAE